MWEKVLFDEIHVHPRPEETSLYLSSLGGYVIFLMKFMYIHDQKKQA
jgi:hypothetical protein